MAQRLFFIIEGKRYRLSLEVETSDYPSCGVPSGQEFLDLVSWVVMSRYADLN